MFSIPKQINFEASGCLIMMSEVEPTPNKRDSLDSPSEKKRKSSPFNFKFTRKSERGSSG